MSTTSMDLESVLRCVAMALHQEKTQLALDIMGDVFKNPEASKLILAFVDEYDSLKNGGKL